MKSSTELRQRLAEATDEMETILAGDLDDGARRRFDALEAKARTIQADLDRLESFGQRSAYVNAPAPKPTISHLWGEPGLERHDAGESEYRRMFRDQRHDDKGGFNSLGDFLSTIISGRADPRLNTRALGGAVGSDGGYAMPVGFAWMLADEIFRESVVLGMGVRRQSMTAREVVAPAWDTSTMATGGPGGITAAWTQENAAATESTPNLRQITLHARRLSAFVGVSRELIEDSPGFDRELISAMGKTLAHELDAALVNGDGAAKPLGILQSNALISIAAETGQAASSIVLENLVKAYARMTPAAQRRARWLASPTTIPELYMLSQTIGTGGARLSPMREESGNFYIFGLPVHFSDWCPVVGQVGDISLVDPLSYLYGLLGDSIRIDYSQHYRFQNYQTVFLASIRCDGLCTQDAVVTASDGSTTYAPVINIAARA